MKFLVSNIYFQKILHFYIFVSECFFKFPEFQHIEFICMEFTSFASAPYNMTQSEFLRKEKEGMFMALCLAFLLAGNL